MPQLITNLARTTEIEAVNAMLSAIGESPVTDPSTDTRRDVVMAYNILKDATRELQSAPWAFNSEEGVEVSPTTTYAWIDTAGVTTTLNVFKLPAGVSQWTTTKCLQNGLLNLVERPSKKYQESSKPVLVLYDKTFDRDGADAGSFPRVYIDAIYTFDFEQLPETARRYATVVAGRRFTQRVVGSDSLAGFAREDEHTAYLNFFRDQAKQEDLNMLYTLDSFLTMGGRSQGWGGYMAAVFPGGA